MAPFAGRSAETGRSLAGGPILALVTDAFGGYGGIAQYNRDFILGVAALPGVTRIDVLPRLAAGPLEELPGSVRQLRPIHDRLRYSAVAIGRALRTRPKVVFCGHIYHGPLAQTVARLTGAKLVSQLHGTEIWGDIAAHHRRSLEASDLVLTVSRDTRAKLLARADVSPEKAIVLNNTIGRDFTPGNRSAARDRFGLAAELAILTVARLDGRDGYKGHDQIIPLIAKLRGQGLCVRYLIAGIGEDRQRLESLAQACGVATEVTFLGKVPREDLPDLYRAADLFALPSTGEGFGIAFIEAMACGTPAIGLAVGGAPDGLGDGDLGICVDLEAFPDALSKALLSDRPDPHELSAKVAARFGEAAFRASIARHLS